MTWVTNVQEIRQALGARGTLRYRIASVGLAGTATASDGIDVGERAVAALLAAPGDADPLRFALHLLSAPSDRIPVSALRAAAACTTQAARAAGLPILGGHTLDIDAMLSCLMTIELLAPGASGATGATLPPDLPEPGGLPRRPCMGYAQVHGCGAKLPPDRLAELLPEMLAAQGPASRRLLASDDAVVLDLADGHAMAATVDVITPITQDPLSYGRIAVAGALSDLYAKGSTPVGAVALLGAPPSLDPATRAWVLEGAREKLAEAGAVLVGLHEVPSGELFFGLFCVGLGSARRTRTKASVRLGDRLVLTKPLGTGLLSTVEKRTGLAGQEELRQAARSTMEALNAGAASVLDLPGISASTDVTGFSLVGHLLEMLPRDSDLGARLDAARIPLIGGDALLDLLDTGMDFCSVTRNKHFLEPRVAVVGRGDPRRADVLFDAQTSGGLLLAVHPQSLSACLAGLAQAGVPEAAVIGEIVTRRAGPKVEIDLAEPDAP